MLVLCYDIVSVNMIQVSGTGGGAANGDGTLTLSCESGQAAGVGFDGLDPGSHLKTLTPLTETSARLTWRNDSTVDTVTLYVVCAGFL